MTPWIPTAMLVVAVLALQLAACAPETPRDRVVALVHEAEAAVEARKVPRLRPLVSPEFLGPGSMDREEALAIARRYLLIHRDLYVLSRVARAAPEGQEIYAVVYAALAGRPIESPQMLSSLDAQIMRFDLILSEDDRGELRVTRADWAPATARDMLLARWQDALL